MPRKARIQSRTNYYHVIVRGNNRDRIFVHAGQKKFYLNLLKKQNTDKLIDVAAYCLMDNHVHLIVKAEPDNLVKAMKSLNTTYAMNFNRHTEGIGHVFQDRYRSEAINDERYLLQVVRYIHNNPVKAKMVKRAEDYNWSSYNEYIKGNSNISAQQKEFIMGYFNNSFEQFVEFHMQNDLSDYLEIKEDVERERIEQAKEIMSNYLSTKGITEGGLLITNKVYLKEIIQHLLEESRLTHRQISALLKVNTSIVHNVNLNMRKDT